MHANDCFRSTDPATPTSLPTIDDTIAAVALLGRILDELKARLAAAERTVACLQREKVALRSELRSIVDCVARHPAAAVVRAVPQPEDTPLEDALLALIQGADRSFGRAAAGH